jgi:hypothetical protein
LIRSNAGSHAAVKPSAVAMMPIAHAIQAIRTAMR